MAEADRNSFLARFEPGAVDDAEAPRLGEEIGAPGEGGGDTDIGSGDGLGEAAGGGILAEFIRREPCRDDRRQPRLGERRDVLGAEDATLAQCPTGQLDAMREDRPWRIRDRDLAKCHTERVTPPRAP